MCRINRRGIDDGVKNSGGEIKRNDIKTKKDEKKKEGEKYRKNENVEQPLKIAKLIRKKNKMSFGSVRIKIQTEKKCHT